MRQNFIKFRKESVQLASVFASASGNNFDTQDITKGTLVIGTYDEGNYLAMGWLRGMTRDRQTGEILYEIVNAVEEGVAQFIKNPKRVNSKSVPLLAARCINDYTPVIGRAFACNGDVAILDLGEENGVASTEFIYRLEHLFKETN